MISSLVLTIATCLSGLETAANANNLDSIYSEANDIIEKAEKAYDYSFNLDISSLAKQKLFAYEKKQGTLIGMTASAAIVKVTSCLSSIWAKVVNVLKSLNQIVATILLMIEVACITVISSMMVLGAVQKGYALGFLRYSFLNWEPYAGFIE